MSNVSECVQKRLIFPATKLDALRAKIAVESGVENPTRAEVVSALLYKSATKAAASSSANIQPSKLVHYLNVRTMIKPRLRRSAIGNLVSTFSTTVGTEAFRCNRTCGQVVASASRCALKRSAQVRKMLRRCGIAPAREGAQMRAEGCEALVA
uniref:Acylsugar acyltransferase 3-like n=1 Tax=Nicotiana tabacum TaxID=4097 RepID=A0A1S4CT98_TOBAC